MKKFLIVLSTGIFIFNIVVSAQNKHSQITKYPSYSGLVMAGYQGWFRAPKDGLMYPDETRISLDMWPDVSEYEKHIRQV